MASIEKYAQSAVYAILRHNERTAATHSNPDIDPEKADSNYRLSPDHGCTDYDYFKEKLQDYTCMNRKDVVKMASWVITAPKDLPIAQEPAFFECCHAFLKERYGAENELQAIVHYDEIHTFVNAQTGCLEKSRPHLHYSFIPAITDEKGKPHICCKKVIDRKELRNFHGDLQRFINQWKDGNGRPLHATVYSGVTRQNGGNITVKELKSHMEERRFVF